MAIATGLDGPAGRGGGGLVALGVGAWLLFRSDDEEWRPGGEVETELSGPVSDLVSGMSTEDLVDQVLLLGFEGTDSSAPFVDELRERQLGGVIVASENWTDATAGTALVDELRSAAGGAGNRAAVRRLTGRGRVPSASRPPSRADQLLIGDADSVAGAERWAPRPPRPWSMPASTSTCFRSRMSPPSTRRSPTAPSPTSGRRVDIHRRRASRLP